MSGKFVSSEAFLRKLEAIRKKNSTFTSYSSTESDVSVEKEELYVNGQVNVSLLFSFFVQFHTILNEQHCHEAPLGSQRPLQGILNESRTSRTKVSMGSFFA
jgi:hypothetical protein